MNKKQLICKFFLQICADYAYFAHSSRTITVKTIIPE